MVTAGLVTAVQVQVRFGDVCWVMVWNGVARRLSSGMSSSVWAQFDQAVMVGRDEGRTGHVRRVVAVLVR